MKILLTTFIAITLCLNGFAQVDTSQQVTPGRVNSPEQQKKPYVIMISVDGMRYDYMDRYHAGHLLALSGNGVRAESMIPSYPSVTFPNHYTLVTGLYPSHHGLSQNDFYSRDKGQFYSMSKKEMVRDSSWYGGTPLWVLAEQQKMLTASYYWVATEAAVKGVHLSYYYNYNTKTPIDSRIQAVVNWLKLPPEKRPHLITFYFPEVDHDGHTFGPESPETEKSVKFIDESVYRLTQAVKATGLDVNFILVSDHGMTKVDREHPITLPVADTTKFRVSGDGILVEWYARNKADIEPAYQKLKREAAGYNVYLKKDMPARLHYGTADDQFNTIGDILLIPVWPKVFQYGMHKINIGWHGFDPYMVKDMHATFIAWGPAFKHLKIPAFKNVDVFPMVSRILGLNYADKIDGTENLANQILVK